MRARHWLFLMVLLALPLVSAATLTCTIRASTSCNAGEALLIRLNSSEAGAAPNNSHAQLANSSANAYPYSVCCATDAFRSIVNTCSATSTTVLKLYNHTDSHVQAGTQSGYVNIACLNVTAGNITCEYPNDSCSGGFSQVVSIASSEAGDNNLTNAHVGSFGLYKRKVCCQVGGQSPPVVAWANVTPNPTATTRNDLLCANGSVTDADGDSVTLHYNWYRNGTSITTLNLPMDFDGSVTHDISGYGYHPSSTGSPLFLPTGGKVGGGFLIDKASSQHFSIANTNHRILPTGDGTSFGPFTIMLWFKPQNLSTDTALSGFMSDETYLTSGFRFGIDVNNKTSFWSTESGGTVNIKSTTTLTANTWYHITLTYNGSTATLYTNGASEAQATGVIKNNTNSILIGGGIGGRNNTNGTIDEVIIFNRSLSASEVSALYSQYNRNLSGTELRRNDRWNCSITPVDSTGLNGTTKFSNQTNISGSPPLAVTLLYPINGNTSVFERYVNFSWSTADERDGDQVNYTLNYTVQPGVCSVQGTVSNIQTTNRTVGELCTDQYYNWTVQACDVEGCSSLSSRFNFTIASVVSIRLLNNNTNFGTLAPGYSVATDLGNATPFIVENDGNVIANVTVNATNSPFTLAALGTTNFQYKARQNESSAYNASGSQTTYTPVDSIVKNVLKQLNYSDAADAAYVDINITVPLGEPPGSKTTNVTFRAQVAT